MGRIARHVHRMAVVCVRKCGALSSYMQELAKKTTPVHYLVVICDHSRRKLSCDWKQAHKGASEKDATAATAV